MVEGHACSELLQVDIDHLQTGAMIRRGFRVGHHRTEADQTVFQRFMTPKHCMIQHLYSPMGFTAHGSLRTRRTIPRFGLLPRKMRGHGEQPHTALPLDGSQWLVIYCNFLRIH